MSRLKRAFTDHPASVGETYLEHLRAALGFSATLVRAAACCAVHALVPCLFERTGSAAIEDLHERMVRQRSRHSTTNRVQGFRRVGPGAGLARRAFTRAGSTVDGTRPAEDTSRVAH